MDKKHLDDILDDKIVIRKEYFDNIETTIKSINEFFSSNFKTKNFPVRDGSFEIDKCLEIIIELIDNVDVSWVTNQERATEVLNEIFESINDIDKGGSSSIYEALHNNNDTQTLEKVEAFMGYYTLTTIADNFQEFTEFINGIYTFELFTKPSKYKSIIETFSKHINMEDLETLFNEDASDIPCIFNSEIYVKGLFDSELITMPDELDEDTEIKRINEFRDTTVDVLIDENTAIQEAATTNYFVNDIKKHIAYNDKTNKFQISKQYQKIVNDFISEIEKANDIDDLAKVFTSSKASDYPDDLMEVCVPFIVCKVFNNTKKYSFDTFNVDELGKFIKSYKSIAEKNPGAKRFVNYDLFSVFKTDKEGTVKFLKDYFNLSLYNDNDAYIANNTLLTLFNIFDSRIYLDILYNSIPENIKKNKFNNSEDKFVKDVRAKINKNSHSTNIYKQDDAEKAIDAKDSKTVTEYVADCLKAYGDMSVTDMMFCEHYQNLIKEEIACIGDVMYNKNVSSNMIDKYIGESYQVINEGFFDIFKKKIKCDYEKYKKILCKYVNNVGIVVDGKVVFDLVEFNEPKKSTITTDKNISAIATDKSDNELCYDGTKKQYVVLYKDSDETIELGETIKDIIIRINKDDKKSKISVDINNNMMKLKFETDYILDVDKNDISLDLYRSYLFVEDRMTCESYEFFKYDLEPDGEIDYMIRKALRNVVKDEFELPDDEFITLYETDILGITMDENSSITFKFKIKRTNEIINYTLPDYYCESFVQESFFNNAGFLNLRSKIADALGEKFIVSNMMNPMGKKEPRFTIKPNDDANVTINIDSMGNAIAIGIMNGYTLSNYAKGVTLSSAFNKILNVIEELFPSKQISESYVQEQETGDIPEYMRNRIQITDESNDKNESEHRHTEASLDIGVDDLASSVDAKLAYGGDTLDESLGSGFKPSNEQAAKKAESQIIYNITNNYTNSFNKDSNNTSSNTTTNNDLSSNKQTTTNNTNSHNDSSNNKDNSQRKKIDNIKPDNSQDINNNNNNSTKSIDTKDDINNTTFSNGKTLQEVFAFLESEEPLSTDRNAGDPPKEDMLTFAMDVDKNTLSAQQTGKRKAQKVVNTEKAFLKPVNRTKKWLTDLIDSLIKRDEDKVKAEIIENPSYRTSLYKAMRLGLKLGLTGICFTVSGYLGAAYVVAQGAKIADKQRLKKEVQEEFATELDIINSKIQDCPNDEEGRKAKYKMMRLKSKMERMLANSPRSTFKSTNSAI